MRDPWSSRSCIAALRESCPRPGGGVRRCRTSGRRLDLPGYPGGSDVVGNRVSSQFQLDAFGEALLLFATAAGHGRLDPDAWRAAEIAAEAIEARWREPDAGIWELAPDEWTHSRLICAAGLRATVAAVSVASRRRCPRSRTRSSPRPPRARVHRSGRWQRPRRRAGRRGAAPAGAARRDPARRPAHACHAAGRRGRVDRGRLRLPLPARRAAAGPGGGRVPALRLPARARLRPTGDAVAAARWFERNRAACGPPASSRRSSTSSSASCWEPATSVRPRPPTRKRRDTVRPDVARAHHVERDADRSGGSPLAGARSLGVDGAGVRCSLPDRRDHGRRTASRNHLGPTTRRVPTPDS